MDDQLVQLEAALITAGLRPSAAAVQVLATAIDQRVQKQLASLGGDLLASHGPNSATPDQALATLGGYLLGHWG